MKRFLLIVCSAALAAGCVKPGRRTAVGAGTGAAVGAGAGAVLGHQTGKTGQGAVIGGVVGGLIGSAVGNKLDRQARELERVAETQRTENGIITTLRENILFDKGSSALKPAAADSVNQISDIIKKYPEDKVIVVGHTDSEGPDAYNQQLSEHRAQAVRLAMVSRGVPAASVEVVGQGETSPVAANDTADGRAQNRRVELHITVDPAKSN